MNNKHVKTSPWGAVQTINDVAEGIYFVSTASHGGLKLDRGRNAKMPDFMRRPGGWYEEDNEAVLPAIIFSKEFFGNDLEKLMKAKAAFRNDFPDQYERLFGVKLKEGESYTRDKANFEKKAEHSLVVKTAWGHGSIEVPVPEGFVRVEATIASEPEVLRTFFIPQDEYRNRPRFGFIVDPEKHNEVFDETAIAASEERKSRIEEQRSELAEVSKKHIVIGRLGSWWRYEPGWKGMTIEEMLTHYPKIIHDRLSKIKKSLDEGESILNPNLQGVI